MIIGALFFELERETPAFCEISPETRRQLEIEEVELHVGSIIRMPPGDSKSNEAAGYNGAMDDSIPFPYKSKKGFVLVLILLAAFVTLTRIGPKSISIPFFGAARPVQVVTETLRYQDELFSFDYPSQWSARDVSTDPVVQNYLPGLTHVVAIGPGRDIEHAVFLSARNPADTEKSILDREEGSGRNVTERTPADLAAGQAIKLTFVSKTDANDRRTYYVLQNDRTAVILLHGPGNQTLDTAGQMILKTFLLAPQPQPEQTPQE